MNRKYIEKIILVLTLLIMAFCFSCKKNVEEENINVSEIETTEEVIKEIDVSDVENASERNLLLRVNNLNLSLGKDIYVSKEDIYKYRNTKIVLIGDSIADGAKSSLTKYFKNITIDSVPGREIKTVYDVFYGMYAYGKAGDILVISLGTNASDGIPFDKLEAVYEKYEGKPIFILTVVLPYKGQERNRNRDIKKFVENHENVHLIDFNKVIKSHPEFFNEDKIHPTGEGGEVYAQLIFKSIANFLKTQK